MGSNFNKGIDAATSIATGVITGGVIGGIAGASAPYLAGVVKDSTPKDSVERYVAHGILGAGVAILQGNSVLAGAAGAAGGEYAASAIVKYVYNKEVNDLTESEKQNISNLSQLASGLTAATISGGNMSDAGAAISASKNAVENNLLSNQHGVEKLDKENKELYEKIKDVVGYDEIDQLQKQYMNCQSDECKTAVYNDYYQKDQEAGQKLVDLYKSGQLTKADFEQLVTWYNDSMLEGVEQAKKDAGGNRNFWDIYDASSMDMTPAGLIGNPYLAEIRGLILLEQWRSEGLSESQIQEKFLTDEVLGAFGSAPDINSIVHQIRNDGLSLEDGLKLATLGAFSKITNDASKGKTPQIVDKGNKLILDSKKFDYLFGNSTSNEHNANRSNQLAFEMKKLGIYNDAQGQQILNNHFQSATQGTKNIINSFSNDHGQFEVRQSLLIGPSGKGTMFESTFQIMPDGSRRFVTTIPKRGAK